MTDSKDLLKDLRQELTAKLAELDNISKTANNLSEVELAYTQIEQDLLGKKSPLNTFLKSLKDIQDLEARKTTGIEANKLQSEIAAQIAAAKEETRKTVLKQQLITENIDATRPGIITHPIAHQHVISKTVEEIETVFTTMGFEVGYALEVDSEFNNFDSLNIPENHPARDNWDTLWLSDGNLGITQTTAMDNRIIKNSEVPIKRVTIGRCFRNEATDARHEHTFMQVDGVYLARKSSMGEMLGVLLEFFQGFFGKELKYKFTPDFFPFVEPGGQMAIECVICNGDSSNCKVCKGSGYLEVLGCGMLHPRVIEMAGKDPKDYSGFAWGFGVERMAMIKHQIHDLRYFYSGDLRFIKQFN